MSREKTRATQPTRKIFEAYPYEGPFWMAAEAQYQRKYGSSQFWFTDKMQFDLEGLKDSGEFASVFRAKETKTGRVLAVKRFEKGDMLQIRLRVRYEFDI